MFKIIFNHLNSQTINKPSIASKFNRWSISKSDININRFENTILFFKKELLNSKHNFRKSLNYSNTSICEGIFFFIFSVMLVTTLYVYIEILLKLLKTESVIYSFRYSLFYLLSNQLIFFGLIFFLFSYLIFLFSIKNKKFLLYKFNLKT